MEESYIIVENVNEKELEIILMKLANMYLTNVNANTEYTNKIQLYRKKENHNSFLILFNNSIDFHIFNYFINYIEYPIEFKGFSPFIRGFYKTTGIREKNKFNIGDWIMVYISRNDTEYDNVNLVNYKNENYLFDFRGSIKKLNNIEEIFKLIPYDKNNYHHVIDIIPKNKDKKPWWKFW